MSFFDDSRLLKMRAATATGRSSSVCPASRCENSAMNSATVCVVWNLCGCVTPPEASYSRRHARRCCRYSCGDTSSEMVAFGAPSAAAGAAAALAAAFSARSRSFCSAFWRRLSSFFEMVSSPCGAPSCGSLIA
eukprot:Amastigsp_a342914_66.p3 type:complete len:134 gc:universal Amastigsp_a342914_66:1443-1844(+)